MNTQHKTCTGCDGSGIVSLSGFEADCRDCNGRGFVKAAAPAAPAVPTDEQILDLAERLLTPDFGNVLEFARDLLNRQSRHIALATEQAACSPAPVTAEAITDTQRLDWLLPMMCGDDNPETNARTMCLGTALMAGKDGRQAIDAAMSASQGGKS